MVEHHIYIITLSMIRRPNHFVRIQTHLHSICPSSHDRENSFLNLKIHESWLIFLTYAISIIELKKRKTVILKKNCCLYLPKSLTNLCMYIFLGCIIEPPASVSSLSILMVANRPPIVFASYKSISKVPFNSSVRKCEADAPPMPPPIMAKSQIIKIFNLSRLLMFLSIQINFDFGLIYFLS